MAYDAKLAERVQVWAARHPEVERKAMFGGLCYLVGGNLLGGVKDANLLVRLGPASDAHVGKPHILPFPTAARPMSGFLQVEPAGCASAGALATWLDQAHAFVSTLPSKPAANKAPARVAAKVTAKNGPRAAQPTKKAAVANKAKTKNTTARTR